MNAKLTKILTAGGFLSFFAFGFVDNLKGPLLPELFRAGLYSYSQGGTLFFASYVGFILATLSTGVIADVTSNRFVLFLAAVCLCVGSVGVGTTQNYFALIMLMGTAGLGLGAIELGANALMVELHNERRALYMNLLATCHGCGSLIVPLYCARLLSADWSWQTIYCSSALLTVPMFAVFWPRFKLNADKTETRALDKPTISESCSGRISPKALQTNVEKNERDLKQSLRDGFTREMIVFYLLISTYVAVELSVAAWLMEFLQKLHHVPMDTSSIYLSCFFALLMIGRLIGAFVIDYFDHLTSIGIAIAASTLCLIGGILGGGSMIILLPISGFFMSIVFPTVTAAVTKRHISKSGTMLGILFACGGIGGALGPWIVGTVSQLAGIKVGLSCSILFAMFSLGSLCWLKRNATET